MTVAVDGQGSSRGADDLLDEEEIAVGILGLTEQGIRDDVGGIVDGANEGQERATVLEPIVAATIELEQHAFLRRAVAARAMLGRTTSARGGEASLKHDAAQRSAR